MLATATQPEAALHSFTVPKKKLSCVPSGLYHTRDAYLFPKKVIVVLSFAWGIVYHGVCRLQPVMDGLRCQPSRPIIVQTENNPFNMGVVV